MAKLRELPDWPSGLDPMSGHAVAFPNAEVESLGTKVFFLGPDADPDLIIDRAMLEPDGLRNQRLREWVDRAFELWSGGRQQAPRREGIAMLEAMITSPLELRSLLRSEIKDGHREVVRLTDEQLHILNTLRGSAPGRGRRGSGDRQDHARDRQGAAARRGGVRDPARLLQLGPRARARGRDPRGGAADRPADGQDLPPARRGPRARGRDAGREARPGDRRVVRARIFPNALDYAIGMLGPRYHAIVVDEAQDLDAFWLASLDGLLHGGREDVTYVFHDPAQSIYRPDQIGQLGLTEYPLDFNCRNPQPVHAILEPLALGGLASQARRTDGREPELIKADDDAETIEELRKVLHRLVA